ncbi:hypothetical protein PALU110988_10700 [Paenibacillus lupini]|nr:hypothetical protein [Paenibacillus lupini]
MGACSCQPLAKSKGVHREVESEVTPIYEKQFSENSFYQSRGETKVRVQYEEFIMPNKNAVYQVYFDRRHFIFFKMKLLR